MSLPGLMTRVLHICDAGHRAGGCMYLALTSLFPYKNNNQMKKILSLLAVFGLMAGCSSTRITSAWKAPDAQPRSYQKIMVVGIIREADRNIREKMEDHLVGDLRDLGYNAVSAYREFGPKTFENLDEQQVL